MRQRPQDASGVLAVLAGAMAGVAAAAAQQGGEILCVQDCPGPVDGCPNLVDGPYRGLEASSLILGAGGCRCGQCAYGRGFGGRAGEVMVTEDGCGEDYGLGQSPYHLPHLPLLL